MFVNPSQEKIGLSENDEFWARLWWPNTRETLFIRRYRYTRRDVLYYKLYVDRLDERKTKN